MIAKRAVIQGDFLKIFNHVRSHNSSYIIVIHKDTIDVTLSGVINYDTKPPWPTFHILVWRLREGTAVKIKLFLLVYVIKCFVLLTFVKMLLFVDLQKWSHRFFLLMNQICVMITYWEILNTLNFFINCCCHCVLNQVHLYINLLDNMILTKIVLQPTDKPRSISPHKLKLKKTTSKKKSRLKNKTIRSVSTQIRRGSLDPCSDEENILQQSLFYTNKDIKTYQFIDTD